jgi:hypothetical protein
MNSRYKTFKVFNKYYQKKDDRSMEDICSSSNGEFTLQVQQNFLKEYMKKHPDWKRLLLYHEIGSGKTCSAITMAEEFLKLNSSNKVTIILPARLKTNMFDELISPCGFNEYISKEDFILYYDSSVSSSIKKKIKKKFMKKINEKYDIMSFEKFRINMMKHKNNILEYLRNFTKNNMIIVDEVHNLFSIGYSKILYDNILKRGSILSNYKGLNTILLKLLSKYCDDSCKMILLTATPIFDKIEQLKELVSVITPEAVMKDKPLLSEAISFLRGKVSYFPGTSLNAYPTSEYKIHEVVMSKTQDLVIHKIKEDKLDDENEDKESFMAKQRQAAISSLPDNKKIKDNIKEVLSDLKEYAPKINLLKNIIKDNPGKHIVYTNFVESSINIIIAYLRNNGWLSLKEVVNNEALWKSHKNKIYAIWSGNTKDIDKQLLKAVANNKDNLYGDKLRLIIGSPSIKEGVSFKHIQHIHLLDPVWNISSKKQIEGRAIRYCSHIDIDEKKHRPLKRNVVIHIYKLIPDKDSINSITCDQQIYDNIMIQKQERIIAGEDALKKVAIDYYLFRKLYNDEKDLVSPKSPSKSKGSIESDISLSNDISLKNRQNIIVTTTSTCPAKKRPVDGVCPNGYYVKNNKQNFPCCYKNKKTIDKKKDSKKTTKCPKNRIPIDGKCKDGFKIKTNKSGIECCYKKTKKDL